MGGYFDLCGIFRPWRKVVPPLYTVRNIDLLFASIYSRSDWQDDIEITHWLEIICPFTAADYVTKLRNVSRPRCKSSLKEEG
jgi:hypothetical protein